VSVLPEFSKWRLVSVKNRLVLVALGAEGEPLLTVPVSVPGDPAKAAENPSLIIHCSPRKEGWKMKDANKTK
jgi:hypothetical protein